MADRYWVGGTADWDATAGTKWATTSGGAGGASVPGSADNVFFDGNSGSGTITLSSSTALSLTTTGFAGTVAGSGVLGLGASLTLNAGVTWTATGDLSLSGNVGGTITSAGKTLGSVTKGAGTGNWDLGDALTMSGTFTWQNATFTTNNHNISAADYSISGGTVVLGSSMLTATGDGGWNTSGATVTAGTSTIKLTSNGNTLFAGGGQTYNVVWRSHSGAGYFLITGANTFAELKDDGTAAHTIFFPASTTTTVTTFTVSGSAGNLIKIYSASPGSQFTLSKSSGSVTCDYVDIKDSVASGGATWVAQHSTDSGNNSGWTFEYLGHSFGIIMG